MNIRKNGNRHTKNGSCKTDVMAAFIKIWKHDFNARLVARKCHTTVNQASCFLYSQYRKNRIDKTKHKLERGMINYKLKKADL